MTPRSTRPRCAAALSTSPDLDAAVAEVCDELDERLDGTGPDRAFLFATLHYGGDLARAGAEIVEGTGASALAGCTGAWTVGVGREEEHSPGIAVLAASFPNTRVDVLRIVPPAEGGEASPPLPIEDPERASLVVVGDPFTFPVPNFLQGVTESYPGVPVAGGLSSGGVAPGPNQLIAGTGPGNTGAKAVGREGGARLVNAVSQGCRPIGPPVVATKVDGNVLLELRGKPAGEVMSEILDEVDEADRKLFQAGAFIGRAIDSAKSTFQPGDLLVRNIMGLDPEQQAIAIADDALRPGSTIQLMVRDGASASAELDSVLEIAGLQAAGEAAGGLLFTCGGRGRGMFGRPHHDAAALERAFGPGFPVAGFSANGEIGVVGGEPFLHGFTASIALFAPRD